MFSNFSIIGIGSLGGFVAKSLACLKTTKSITIIDFDVVEEKNLENSVYRLRDAGKLKTQCLKDIINFENPNTNIFIGFQKFEDNNSVLLKDDLVIDCRDVVKKRSGLINVRLYVSGRNFVIDCKKNNEYEEEYLGKYLESLSKIDLQNCGVIFSTLIKDGMISKLINQATILCVNIDSNSFYASSKILEYENEKNRNFVFEECPKDDKLEFLGNIPETIIYANQKNKMNLILGSINNPLVEIPIDINKLTNREQIVQMVNEIINTKGLNISFNKYMINFINVDSNYYIEVIPETGGA